MQNSKNRLYNFESNPPEGMWEKIAQQLDEEKVIKMPARKISRGAVYGMVAAASLVIIFLVNIFFNKPEETKPIAQNTETTVETNNSQQSKDSMELNHKILETIINSPDDKKLLAYNNLKTQNKYITIEGPEGQPVKISPKAATLIISADGDNPPKPVWDKKIEEWKQIMLKSTLSPTSTNLMDIMKLSKNNVE